MPFFDVFFGKPKLTATSGSGFSVVKVLAAYPFAKAVVLIKRDGAEKPEVATFSVVKTKSGLTIDVPPVLPVSPILPEPTGPPVPAVLVK